MPKKIESQFSGLFIILFDERWFESSFLVICSYLVRVREVEGGEICIRRFCLDSKNSFPKCERRMLEIKISLACVDRPCSYQGLFHMQKLHINDLIC